MIDRQSPPPASSTSSPKPTAGRTVVFGIVLLSVLVWMTGVEWEGALLFGLLLYILFVIKLLGAVRKSGAVPLVAAFVPFDPEAPDLPPEVHETTRSVEDVLARLGFERLGHFEREGMTNGVRGLISLYEHRTSRDLANLIRSFNARKLSTVLMFETRYDDDTYFATGYRRDLTLVPMPQPRLRPGTMVFPQLDDVSRLYEVHQARKPVDVLAKSIRDDPAAFLTDRTQRVIRCWKETPWWDTDPTGTFLRPSWPGCAVGVLRWLWPAGVIRGGWRHLRADMVLRRLRAEGLISR